MDFTIKEHTDWMKYTLNLAREALPVDIPVAAIILNKKGDLVAEAYNRRERDKLINGHAEILAMQKASILLNSWKLKDCIMYTTLEPCLMCIGAIIQSEIKTTIFGAYNTNQDSITFTRYNKRPRLNMVGGILESECMDLLRVFFQSRRFK